MKLQIETDKAAYRSLCQKESSIPLFSLDWWLDAICGPDKWQVALVKKGDETVGALPFVSRPRWGGQSIGQPPLTQTLGPWIRPSNAKYAKAMAFEKDILGALASHFLQYSKYSQSWHHGRTNWLPFHWAGYKQTTRYTYVLPDLTDEQKLWDGLLENIRGDIRKAEGRFGVTVRGAGNLQEFLDLNEKTFTRQGKRPPYSDDLVRRLDKACSEHQCRSILIAEDADGHLHAGAYIVWDNRSAYYLMGGSDPEYRNSGAGSLCLWKAILSMRAIVPSFDFEGSMMEPVERFVRAFGALQTPYLRVYKTNSRLWRFVEAIREAGKD